METVLRYIVEYQEFIILFTIPFIISFAFFLLMAILKRLNNKVRYWHGGFIILAVVLFFAVRLIGLEITSVLFVNRFANFLLILAGFVTYSSFAITVHAMRKRL